MNDQTTKPATVKIEDAETLDLCRQLRDLRRESRKAEAELNERYEAEAKALNDGFDRRNQELWGKLYGATGIDPDGDWTVDTEYLDEHNVAFVKQDEQRHHGGMPAALAQLFGGGNVQIVEERAEEPTLN